MDITLPGPKDISGVRSSFMIRFLGSSLIALSFIVSIGSAQTTQIKGLITGRSGSTMIIETSDSRTVTIVLTDATEVGQTQGVFRRKEMSMTALIPGLAVQVEASYGDNNKLMARSVKFSGDDLKRAQSSVQIKQSQEDIEKSKQEIARNQANLEKQQAALQAQKEALQQQEKVTAEQQKKIAENKAAIAAAIARFGQLDDYYILDEVSVYFANGKVKVEPKYESPLRDLIAKAKSVEGYMIEIKGYASSVGSESLNQKLSNERADNVANYLVQQCKLSLTNLLAPAAMGESEQVGNEKTAEGQAKNRRVTVRILQNKGVVGSSGGD
jgi:OmpA-OmpF porin, OOP family